MHLTLNKSNICGCILTDNPTGDTSVLHLGDVEVSNRQQMDCVRDVTHRVDNIEVEAFEHCEGAHDS